MNTPLRTHLWVILLAVSLSGCGFQLRGPDTAPSLSQQYTVQVKSTQPILNQHFVRQLSRLGFKVTQGATDFVIMVHSESDEISEFGFDSDLSKSSKRLVYRLNYTVVNRAGDLVLGPETTELSTDYFVPSGDYLRQDVADNLQIKTVNHLQMETAKIAALERLRTRAADVVVSQLIGKIEDPSPSAEQN